jgi:hypothetical protein
MEKICSFVVSSLFVLSISRIRYRSTYVPVELTLKNYPSIVNLSKNTFGGHDYIQFEFFNWFKLNCIILGLQYQNEIVAIFVLSPEGTIGHLEALRVDIQHRNKGLGHRMQEEMIEFAKTKRVNIKTLRYTVYDENLPSVKIALRSEMKIKYSFPYTMITEDVSTEVFVFRSGNGILKKYLQELEQVGKEAVVYQEIKQASELIRLVKVMNISILYQDWKAIDVNEVNICNLIKKQHQIISIPNGGGISIGLIREDGCGKFCIFTYYEEDQDKTGLFFILHMIYWFRKFPDLQVKSVYFSYPISVHSTLRRFNLAKQEPQQELVFEMEV